MADPFAAALAAARARAAQTHPNAPDPEPIYVPNAPLTESEARRLGLTTVAPVTLNVTTYPAPTRYGQCSRCGGPNDNPEAANGAAYCHGCTRDLNARPAANVAPIMRAMAPAAPAAPAPVPAPTRPSIPRRESRPAPVPASPAAPDLHSASVLVDVDVKMFTGTVTDKRVTREVHTKHGSDADMGRFSKRLIGSEHLTTIRRLAQEAGDEHRKRSLPWGEGRVRIMSSDAILPYESAMRNIKERFDAAVDDLVAEWGTIVEESRRRLGGNREDGGMFDPAEYPSAQMIRDRFSIKTRIDRLPAVDASDFRRTLGKAAADALEAQMRANVAADLKAAQQEMVDRIRDTVGHMADRLKADRVVKGQTLPAIFRDTLLTNVRDLANLVGSLNITNDPRVTDLAAEMLALAGTDPEVRVEALRKGPAIERQRIAEAAEDLVAKAEEMFG